MGGSSLGDFEEAIATLIVRGQISAPPYPAVALKLRTVVEGGDFGLDELTRIIAADPVLAADILRLANSGLYARAEPSTALPRAVARVGSKEIARLALASGVATLANGKGPLRGLRRFVWQNAVASAVICERLGDIRGELSADAFLCGLLHDLGKVLVIGSLEELLAKDPGAPARPLAEWHGLTERLHVELGLLVATRWHLPEVFTEVMSLHHEGSTSGKYAGMLAVVAASDAVVEMMIARPAVSAEDLRAVPGLTEREREHLAAALPTIPEVIASFERKAPAREAPSMVQSIDPSTSDPFRPIAAKIQQTKPISRGPYELCAIASGALRMTGKGSMHENALVELVIASEPEPLELWANVTLCVPEGDGFRIECKPFALSGHARAQWDALVRSAH
jgi:HD-like signal output (HDOD) protein